MTVLPPLSKAAMARALGLCRNTVHAYCAKGLPLASVEAAQAWLTARAEAKALASAWASAPYLETAGRWAFFSAGPTAGDSVGESWAQRCHLRRAAVGCGCGPRGWRTPRERRLRGPVVRVRWARKTLVVSCVRCGATLWRLNPKRLPPADLAKVPAL